MTTENINNQKSNDQYTDTCINVVKAAIHGEFLSYFSSICLFLEGIKRPLEGFKSMIESSKMLPSNICNLEELVGKEKLAAMNGLEERFKALDEFAENVCKKENEHGGLHIYTHNYQKTAARAQITEVISTMWLLQQAASRLIMFTKINPEMPPGENSVNYFGVIEGDSWTTDKNKKTLEENLTMLTNGIEELKGMLLGLVSSLIERPPAPEIQIESKEVI